MKNGWMRKEEVVKVDHEMDWKVSKKEKGVMNGEVEEECVSFEEGVEVGNEMELEKGRGRVKKKKEEEELE
ncbi:hypothetical protein, partial [Priestia megaterium]|uniref:hypothetical protein n=1 Tax=Priestia megaterium TaxID=1404 RepID=UPI0012B9C1D6